MKEFKPRTIQQFGCDYCNKRLQRKERMAEHEMKCYYNEDRVCPNCFDHETGENTGRIHEQHDDHHGGLMDAEVDCQACKNADNALELRKQFLKDTMI